MGFSKQEYWSGLPFPPPGDLPNPEVQAASLVSPACGFLITSATWEVPKPKINIFKIRKVALVTWEKLKTTPGSNKNLSNLKYPSMDEWIKTCAIYKLRFCGDPSSSKSISTIFQLHLLTSCLCYILVILAIFQTFIIIFIMVICDQ